MKKIGAVIVDDSPIERQAMRAQISRHPSLALVGEADTLEAGLEVVRRECPQVLFLDICLGSATGFELLHLLEQPPRVVFVTSSPNHGPEAFAVDAVDYLVKPVAPPRFEVTARRLENLFFPGSAPQSPYRREDRICLRSGAQTHLVLVSRLVLLAAEGNFTRVTCADGLSLLIGGSLGELEALLPHPPFARLDRSLLINLERVERAERLARNFSRLWLRGLSAPLELGRTATERLREIFHETGMISG